MSLSKVSTRAGLRPDGDDVASSPLPPPVLAPSAAASPRFFRGQGIVRAVSAARAACWGRKRCATVTVHAKGSGVFTVQMSD
jgi:hypothetical protein